MKTIKIISHPITLISCFLLVLISGQHLGGFYLLYILLGLPHGAIHSILAIAGIAIILFSNYKYKREFNYLIEPILNMAGVSMLSFSLLVFFVNDEERYNYSTFDQTVPVISLILFGIVALCFSLNNLISLFRRATFTSPAK